MKRPPKGQLVNLLLVAAALALVVVVVVTRGKVTTSERDARSDNVLPAYREDDITRVTLERDGKRLVLERTEADDAGDRTWYLKEPIREEADAFAIDKLLGSLEYARATRRIKPEEVNRQAFGLDAPAWVLGIEMGSIGYTLSLGKEAASPAGAHYLDVAVRGASGSGVVIISKDLVAELDIDAGKLRGRQVLPYVSPELSRIVIAGTDGVERHLTSFGDRAWRFSGMMSDARVDRETFDQVLVQFARIKADEFLSLSEAEPALKKGPHVTLTLVPKDAKKPKCRVDVGGACPNSENDIVAIRREPEPMAACVPKSVLPGLDTSAEALVDRHPFWLRKDEVESLRIERGDKKLELDRKENGFVLRSPVKGDVELEAGNRRIEEITHADGELVSNPDLAKLGLEHPSGRASVSSAAESDDKVQKEDLDIGVRRADGRLIVRRAADGIVLALPEVAARALEADATLVRSRTVFDFPAKDLTSLEITTPSLHEKLTRPPDGNLELLIPKGFAHDPSLVSTLVDDLSRLQADRWAADRDDGSFGLAQPRVRVELSIVAGDAGSQRHTLLVGAPTTGGSFAKLESEPGVFVAPRRMVDALETWVLDRSLFVVTPDVAQRVTLSGHGKKIVLEKQGSRFVAAAGTELSDTRTNEVFETLVALRAEAAVHTGPAKSEEGFDHPELTVELEGAEKSSFRIGAGDAWQGTSVYYARKSGVDATFVIARSKVRALLDAL